MGEGETADAYGQASYVRGREREKGCYLSGGRVLPEAFLTVEREWIKLPFNSTSLAHPLEQCSLHHLMDCQFGPLPPGASEEAMRLNPHSPGGQHSYRVFFPLINSDLAIVIWFSFYYLFLNCRSNGFVSCLPCYICVKLPGIIY